MAGSSVKPTCNLSSESLSTGGSIGQPETKLPSDKVDRVGSLKSTLMSQSELVPISEGYSVNENEEELVQNIVKLWNKGPKLVIELEEAMKDDKIVQACLKKIFPEETLANVCSPIYQNFEMGNAKEVFNGILEGQNVTIKEITSKKWNGTKWLCNLMGLEFLVAKKVLGLALQPIWRESFCFSNLTSGLKGFYKKMPWLEKFLKCLDAEQCLKTHKQELIKFLTNSENFKKEFKQKFGEDFEFSDENISIIIFNPICKQTPSLRDLKFGEVGKYNIEIYNQYLRINPKHLDL
eukprot:GHVP01043632.1.p1 GENE.GHVP01043632.1~~GHVP01043632.1.p1  ORF type:complete len:331 (+),score=59.79 GHVP01043632.1:117-995(+)